MSLFNDNQPDVKRAFCSHCRVMLPISSFHKNASRHTGLSSKCKSCKGVYQKGMRLAHRNNSTQKPLFCDCCSKRTDNLNFDHDRHTNLFRGWVCSKCNTGLANLGDSIEGVQQGLDYLRRHYDRPVQRHSSLYSSDKE
jgi:hypothetical protein